MQTPEQDAPKRSKRGFASMSPERLHEIARKGGKAVPSEKRSFFVNRKLAKEAGEKGGKAVQAEARSFTRNPALAARAGKKAAARPSRSRFRRGGALTVAGK